ncbi:hypothetical protein O6H91_13G026200 [Diphasiastrum complanatum]|uniref:Uncharacterized protein n=1 Tax=Diphasiastrum complanatum TaxID=34168 RepID=A0ACC2BT11_DIPCM|nr:hypothetical protein O6H91_13G026200 [Diphasiastrum complanatum]
MLKIRQKRSLSSISLEVVAMEDDDDDVAVALEKVVSEWEAGYAQANGKIQELAACGSKGGIADAASLPRLNASAQDSLALLRSLQLQLEVLAPQHPNEEDSEHYQKKLKQWKGSLEKLRLSLRNANLQAKRNIDTHAKEEREALLAGGKDATMRRRNLQTQAGMTGATESVTESLRRTRQMMAQAERGISTLSTLDQSNLTLRKAESEYTGQRTLLRTARNLLSSMQRSDILDRIVLIVGAMFFLLICAYILRKRIVPFKQRVRVPVLESIQVVKSPAVSPHSAAPSYSSAVNDEL